MNLRSIRALFGLSSLFILFAACAAPDDEQDGSEGETTAEAGQAMTGAALSRIAGAVKILVPNGAGTTTRTGVLVAEDKVLTGLEAIPAGVTLSSLVVNVDDGLPTVGVLTRADNLDLGATLLTLAGKPSSHVWPINTTAPSSLLNNPVFCPGYSTSGTSLRAFGTISGAASPGYQVSFTTGFIDTNDDGVPCVDNFNPAAGLLGIALSSVGSVHNQVSGARLAPWLADPTMKALTLTRTRYHNGTGTLQSPASLQACNSAYGATCTASYMNTTKVSLAASPGAGSVTQWFGCSSSSGNTCSVTMNGAKSVTVRFVGCTSCYDDCFDACTSPPGALSTAACNTSCQTKCKGCGFQ